MEVRPPPDLCVDHVRKAFTSSNLERGREGEREGGGEGEGGGGREGEREGGREGERERG